MKIFQVHVKTKTDAEIERDAASEPQSYLNLEYAVRAWLPDQEIMEIVELEKGVGGLKFAGRVPREEVARVSRLLRKHA